MVPPLLIRKETEALCFGFIAALFRRTRFSAVHRYGDEYAVASSASKPA